MRLRLPWWVHEKWPLMWKSTNDRQIERHARVYREERELWERRLADAMAALRNYERSQSETAPKLTGTHAIAMALQELDEAKQRAEAKPPRHIRTIFNSLSRRDRMVLIEAAREVQRHAEANNRIANGVEVIRQLWNAHWPQQE